VTAGVGEGDADAEDRGKCVGRGGQRWEGVEVETGERDCVCRGGQMGWESPSAHDPSASTEHRIWDGDLAGAGNDKGRQGRAEIGIIARFGGPPASACD
jgi:hypothetical protein